MTSINAMPLDYRVAYGTVFTLVGSVCPRNLVIFYLVALPKMGQLDSVTFTQLIFLFLNFLFCDALQRFYSVNA